MNANSNISGQSDPNKLKQAKSLENEEKPVATSKVNSDFGITNSVETVTKEFLSQKTARRRSNGNIKNNECPHKDSPHYAKVIKIPKFIQI